ncbi:MAG: hypothetical protein RMJ84_04280 [Sandaracinaceae bacterium]|nr:hypothetical protein [Sandaracinaceae bacterium]
MRSIGWYFLGLLFFIASCEAERSLSLTSPSARMDFASEDFFAAPWPSEHLRDASGRVDVSRFSAGSNRLVAAIVGALAQASGFGTTSGIQITWTDPIDPASLQTQVPSGTPEDKVQLIAIDGPHRGQRVPIRVFVRDSSGPWGARNVLTALPVQGLPLAPQTLYALVVRKGLRTPEGRFFVQAPALRLLREGKAPAGLEGEALEAYRQALATLEELGLVGDDLLALAVFRTQDPTQVMRQAAARTLARIQPRRPFVRKELFDDYCVYESTAMVPVYQEGEAPYTTRGGAWQWDGDMLRLDHEEEARILLTLPRQPMPPEGFPLLLLIRTGAGGDRPLVERGPRAMRGAPAIRPGTGLALDLAKIGWAGISIDGPHGGLRNRTGGDEQFLVFNVQNPIALRDNLRQSALELVLLARSLEFFEIDASDCPGLENANVRFDLRFLSLLGHSMGASIAPLVAAVETRFRAIILSGAGASWIENILHKQSPVRAKAIAEALLGYRSSQEGLTESDPVLNFLQWGGEEADAAVYAPLILAHESPPHVLVFQGIVDTYIPPPVANALTLALQLDVAGPVIDKSEVRLSHFESVLDVLPLSGGRGLGYPVRGNQSKGGLSLTRVLTQHAEDGIEDGHEVLWQREEVRKQLRCFLHSLARGTPQVIDPSSPQCP